MRIVLDTTPATSCLSGKMRKTRSTRRTDSPGGFADRLRQLRIQQNLSQVELAERAGISSIHISRYERGLSKPAAEKLQRLAEVLEVSGDYLYEGAETGAARVKLGDRKVLEMFKEVEELPDKDRAYILQVLEDLLTNRKIKAMTAG